MRPGERRRHARYPFAGRLEIYIPDRMIVTARDVCAEGVSFVTERELQVGDQLRLALCELDELMMEMTVRNVRRVGDRFVVGLERT
jgi:hypothetical protein